MDDWTYFTVTEDHLTLLSKAWVLWEGAYHGAPAIDDKRPYGNSDVLRDVAEALGWEFDPDEGLSEVQEEAALTIHEETETALQIALATQSFQAGTYVLRDRYNRTSWVLDTDELY